MDFSTPELPVAMLAAELVTGTGTGTGNGTGNGIAGGDPRRRGAVASRM